MPKSVQAEEFSSEEGMEKCLWLLNTEIELLHLARMKCLKEKSDLWNVVNPLLFAVWDSSRTMTLLVDNYKVRDSYVVARVVVESLINICFIFAEGENAAIRAMSHARQKSYRNLERESQINDLGISVSWSGKDKIEVDNDLQNALDEFTHRNGREKTSWTPETVNQKLEIISAKYGSKKSGSLQWAFFSIYRHASEIAHGTYFGSLYIYGRMEPVQEELTHENFIRNQRNHINLLALMIGGAISAMLEILSSELSGLEEIATLSTQAISALDLFKVEETPE